MNALEMLARVTMERANAKDQYGQADADWRTAIKIARVESFSQQQIAEAAGVTQGRVAQILAGRR